MVLFFADKINYLTGATPFLIINYKYQKSIVFAFILNGVSERQYS